MISIMNVRLSTVLAGAVLALAGCGGGVDFTSATSIAAALNAGGFTCIAWTPESVSTGPKEAGSCDHGDGTTIEVATFASADQLKSALAVFGSALTGADSGGYVLGDTWFVTPGLGDKAQATAVQKILGGTVQ